MFLSLFLGGCWGGAVRSWVNTAPAAYVTDEGSEKRVMVYHAPAPRLGQCIDPKDLTPMSGDGIAGLVANEVIGPQRGAFRYSSRLVSLTAKGSLEASGSKGSGDVAISNHQLVMEWSRYDIETIKGGTPISKGCPLWVNAIDKGIAVRVIFDVALRNTTAESALSFGFGTLATAIATQSAEVQVRYDTVGILPDILPSDAPTNVTSINDLLRVQSALYDAIVKVSGKWNLAHGIKEDDEAATADEKASGQAWFSSPVPPLGYYVGKSEVLLEQEKTKLNALTTELL